MFWIIPALMLPVLAIQNYVNQVEERKNTIFMANFVLKLVLKNENRRKETIANLPRILKELDLE